jgi:hypothetical protein
MVISSPESLQMKKRFTEEQIIAILREAEQLLAIDALKEFSRGK